MPASGGGAGACARSATLVGVQVLGNGGAAHRDAAPFERRAQRLGGELRRVFHADQQVLPAIAQRNGAAQLRVAAAGNALEADAAFAAGGHRADAILDAVELDGGKQRKRRDIADVGAGTDGEREHVIGEGERGDRRTIVGLRIVDAPADGVRLPDVPGVVADDVAIDALDSARDDLVGQVLDGGQRIAGEGAHAIRNGARGQVGVAAADQAQRSADAAQFIGRGLGEHAGLEGEVRAQAGQGERGAEELGVGGRDEIMVGVEFVEGLAGGQVHDLDAPEGGARGGRGIDQLLNALRQGGGEQLGAKQE